MASVATTKMSSRGQVVIPEAVRRRLGLEQGAEFVVVGQGDVVILKRIAQPPLGEFAELLARARQQAKAAGMTPAVVRAAVKRVRWGRRP